MASNSSDGGMKQIFVGGPLLGSRQRQIPSDLLSWDQFEPLITPEIPLSKGQKQRFILLPHARFISVLAYNTGAQIASLIPLMEDENDDKNNPVVIETVCLAKQRKITPETTAQDVLDRMEMDGDSDNEDVPGSGKATDEVVVMAGCHDGTIREFALSSIELQGEKKMHDCGPYHISGLCCRPRRIVRVSKEPIMHLTALPLRPQEQLDGALVYMTLRTKELQESTPADSSGEKVSTLNVSVLRALVPNFNGERDVSLLQKDKETAQRKWHVDNIKCRVGKDKKGGFMNTAPFRLVSVVKPSGNGYVAFVILARASAIHVYYDPIKTYHHPMPLAFSMPAKNPLSAVHVSVNNSDIACGHYHGEITVLNNVLSDVEKFIQGRDNGKQAQDPRKNLLTSKVHWHAHPVASLVYDSTSSPVDPIFYSGGEETVLVTWQISQGTSRPSDVLPRIALGGIVHVACADRIDDTPSNGVLVYCEDNSLQLFESHNKGRLWKLQGLACKPKRHDRNQLTQIQADPRAKNSRDAQVVITGLPEAPGHMHWYDPARKRLSASLEVAPFNRISRTEQAGTPMPTPSICNHAFSEDGDELITVEETPTENTFVGAYEQRGRKEAYGVVTTIRFWSWNDAAVPNQGGASKVPYTLAAAMTYPHGPKNRVSALAMAADGMLACTVSNDEKAFRLWQKVGSTDSDGTRRLPAWTCRYKVTIPAGFSNLQTKRDGVAFSTDASTIAISFGNLVTIWDSDEARYLTCIQHLEGGQGSIDSVQFVSTGRLQDLLLLKSENGVSLQSPFGSRGSFGGWSWGVPYGMRNAVVSDVEMIASHGYAAITVFNPINETSKVVLIDASSGKPALQGTAPETQSINGYVTSMASIGKPPKRSNWGGSNGEDETSFRLLSLTSNGELLLLTADGEDATATNNWKSFSQPAGPTLEPGSNDARKRKRGGPGNLAGPDQGKKSAMEIFGFTSGDNNSSTQPATSELPPLSQNFVRAFVGRSLAKSC